MNNFKKLREATAFTFWTDIEYNDPNHIMIVARQGAKVAEYCEKCGISLTIK